MPLMRCEYKRRLGFKWNVTGTCYTYGRGNAKSRKVAKQRAVNDGVAIGDIDAVFNKSLEEYVFKADLPKNVKLQMKHEKVLTVRMVREYEKTAKQAIDDAIQAYEDGKNEEEILAIILLVMSYTFAKPLAIKMGKDILKYFAADRTLTVRENKFDRKLLKISRYESSIVKWISSQNRIAAQNLYVNGYATHVTSVLTKLVRQDLSRTEIKNQMKPEMYKALGLKKGSSGFEEIVPKNFKGTAKDYYSGLAQTTLTRAQNMERLSLFDTAGITTYEYVAIIDNRTSKICSQLHGREFKVVDAMENMKKVLEAETIDDLKNVAGWRKDLSEFGVNNPMDARSGDAAASLGEALTLAGVTMPPSHFRCRSTIRAIS